MKKTFNSTFKSLLDKYNLPADLNFTVDLPIEVQQLLSDKIIVNDFGVGLQSNWTPVSGDSSNGQSFYEDSENHFHVDWYTADISEKKAFEVGVKTLLQLATSFQNQKILNVQLTYSFQSPDMAKIESQEQSIDDGEHFISDRLSFHTKRDGQIVVTDDLFNNKHYAFLTVDL